MSGEATATVYDDEATHGGVVQLIPVGPKFLVDGHGLSLNPHAAKPTPDEAQQAVRQTRKVRDAIDWVQGDLFNQLESLYGEEASQFIDAEELGISDSTLRNLKWVASRVPNENRLIAPSWSHAQAVAALKPEQQRKWLERAREEGWAVSKLKMELLAATEGGRTKLRYILVVDCGTEPKQEKLREKLEGDGFVVVSQTVKAKKEKKPKKLKKAPAAKKAKGEVTAKRHRAPKRNQRKINQGWRGSSKVH